jgi:hypothetical protein
MAMKAEAASSSETSVTHYPSTRHYTPQYLKINVAKASNYTYKLANGPYPKTDKPGPHPYIALAYDHQRHSWP